MRNPLYRLVETSPPSIEPLTLDEVKIFLRVDQTNDDALITTLITAARMFCEGNTGRSLITRGYSLFLDRWPGARLPHRFMPGMEDQQTRIPVALEMCNIDMPYPPLLAVGQINVYAADNSSTVFDSGSYYVDTAGVPGRVVLTAGALPPLPGRIANGIEIQYTAGYGATEDNVPTLLRQGMLQVIAHLYEHRGDSPDQALLASGAAAIFQLYRLMGLS
jgi:hypothetical protein